MYEKEIVIVNETGLHARPATEFVQLAGTFASTITLRRAKTSAPSMRNPFQWYCPWGLTKAPPSRSPPRDRTSGKRSKRYLRS